jgi:histone acetyltransferase
MNLVKMEGARTGIEYFITYADNYAIGYFKKQGFTKSISMPKGRYQGLIKDYDGGTMMECYVHPSIDFTRIPEMIAAQRKFILDRIRLKANSHKVYAPLPQDWKPNLEGVSRANDGAARAMAIQGMAEAGWTMAELMAATGQGKDMDRAKNALKSELLAMVRKVEEQQSAWPFREPVDTNEVKVRVFVFRRRRMIIVGRKMLLTPNVACCYPSCCMCFRTILMLSKNQLTY